MVIPVYYNQPFDDVSGFPVVLLALYLSKTYARIFTGFVACFECK